MHTTNCRVTTCQQTAKPGNATCRQHNTLLADLPDDDRLEAKYLLRLADEAAAQGRQDIASWLLKRGAALIPQDQATQQRISMMQACLKEKYRTRMGLPMRLFTPSNQETAS